MCPSRARCTSKLIRRDRLPPDCCGHDGKPLAKERSTGSVEPDTQLFRVRAGWLGICQLTLQADLAVVDPPV